MGGDCYTAFIKSFLLVAAIGLCCYLVGCSSQLPQVSAPRLGHGHESYVRWSQSSPL